MKNILPLLCIFLLLSSCSFQKRLYTGGFYMSVKSRSSKPVTDAVVYKKTPQPEFTASSQKGIISLPVYVQPVDSPVVEQCDTVFLRNNSVIKAKVIEVSEKEVRYKYCDFPDGPTYVSLTADIKSITYKNGSRDLFKEPAAEPVNYYPETPQERKNNRRNQENTTAHYVHKRSVASVFFGAFGFIPFYGFPAAIIAINMAARCLNIIKKNPRELIIYKRQATIGLTLGLIVAGVYVLSLIVAVAVALGII